MAITATGEDVGRMVTTTEPEMPAEEGEFVGFQPNDFGYLIKFEYLIDPYTDVMVKVIVLDSATLSWVP